MFFWLATLWIGVPCHNPATTTRGLSGQILPDRLGLEPGCAQDFGHGVGLGWADFEEEPALLGQHLAGAGGDLPVGVEPVGAAIEGKMRVVARHVGGEPGDLARRRCKAGWTRIRSNWPEAAVEPIGGDEAGAGADAEPAGIGGGERERGGADVGADALARAAARPAG